MAVDRRASASKTLAARKKKEEQEKARKAVLTAAKRDVENAKSAVGANERPAYRTGMKNANAGKTSDKSVKSPQSGGAARQTTNRNKAKETVIGKTSRAAVEKGGAARLDSNANKAPQRARAAQLSTPLGQMANRSTSWSMLEQAKGDARKAKWPQSSIDKLSAKQNELHQKNIETAKPYDITFDEEKGVWRGGETYGEWKGAQVYDAPKALPLPGVGDAAKEVRRVASLPSPNLTPEQRAANRAQGAERAKETLAWPVHQVMGAVSGFTGAAYDTADFLAESTGLDKFLPDAVNRYIENAARNANRTQDQIRAVNYERGGTVGGMAGDLTQLGVEMLGQFALAAASGGSSAGAQLGAKSGTVAKVVETLAKSPNFWYSFVRTAGPEYKQALANGASKTQAAVTAITSAIGQAGVEIGGGVETLAGSTSGGWKAALRSALEEGREEVVQDVISGLTNKGVYDRDRAWYGMGNSDAVINPKRLGTEAAMGAFGGGVAGAVHGLVNRPLPVAQLPVNAQTSEDVSSVPLPVQDVRETESVQPKPLPVQTAAQVDVRNAPYKATNAEIRAILNDPQRIAELNAEGANIRGTNAEKRAAIRAWLERGNAQTEETAGAPQEVPDPGILKQGTWKEGEVKPRLKAEEEVRPDSAYRSAEEEELLQAQLDDYLEREAGHAREAASREEIHAETREASDNLQEIIEKCKAIQAQLERGNAQPEETVQQAGLQTRKNASYEVMNERRRRDAQYLREMEVKREAIREWMNNEADREMEATDEGKHEQRDSLQAILEKRMATQAWLDRKAERERMRLTPPPARPDRRAGLQTREDAPREAIHAEIREASDSLQEIIEKCEAIQAQLERENTQTEETPQIPQAETQEMKLAEPVPSSVNSEEQGNSRTPRRETEAVQPVPLPVEDAQKTESVHPVTLPVETAPAGSYDDFMRQIAGLRDKLASDLQNARRGLPGPGMESRIRELESGLEDVNRQLTAIEKNRAQFSEAQEIAEKLGAKFTIADLREASGKFENGTITINPYSRNPVRQVLVHELTHYIESSGQYNALREHVMSFIAQDLRTDVGALINAVTEDYAANGVQLDADGARREIVAKFCEEKLFTDEKSIQRLAETDRGLFRRIRQWISDTIVKLRGTKQQNALRKMERLYEKAVRTVGEVNGYGAAQYAFGESGYYDGKNKVLYVALDEYGEPVFPENRSWRKANETSPMSEWGHAMFADEAYGNWGAVDRLVANGADSVYSVEIEKLTMIDDIRQMIIDAWNADKENDFADYYEIMPEALAELDAEEIADQFDPADIIDSAGAYDDSDLLMWGYQRVFEPNNIGGVKTNDGAVVFDEDLIDRVRLSEPARSVVGYSMGLGFDELRNRVNARQQPEQQPEPLPEQTTQETEAVQPKILPLPGKDNKIQSTARMLHRNIVSGQAEIERLAKAQKAVNPNAADANDWAQVNRTVNSTVDTIAEKALVDRAGNRIDQGWREIIEPLTDMQRETLNLYRWHRHNIDRMSLEQRSAQMIEQARADLRAFVNEHPEFADANKRTLSRFMQAGGETAEKLVTQYEALQNKLGRLSSMENKPVLGYETEKGKKPYSAEQSAKLVEQMEQENPELRVWADRIEEFHDRFMREWVVGSGLLSEELYEEFKVLYPHYVQTYRQKYFSPMEQDEVTRQRNVNTKRPTKNAEGDMDELIHFEDAEMMQISSLVKNARRNEMFRNIYDFAAAHPDKASRYVKIVQKGGWDTDFAADTREPQNFDDLTGAMADEAMIEQGGVCILRLRVDGEVKKMAVSPDFYAGMQNLFGQDQGASDNFMKKTFGTLTNAFKQLTTGRNPLFFLTNLPKDFQTAYINTTSERKTLLGYLADVGGTIQSIKKNSEDWQTFQALGGKDSGFYRNEKGFTRSLADAQKGKLIDKIWAPVDMISENTEALWRFNEYRTAIRQYGDTQEGRVKAMQAAADITTNFSRSAPATKAAENYCAYLNASVQGLDKMARQIKEHPFLTTRRAAEIIALPTLLLYLVNRDDDDYKELNNRTKDNYYCVPVGDGRFLKIPKSREYGVVMGALLERFFRLAEGEEAKKAFAGIGSQFFANIAPSNPFKDNILKSVFIDLPTNRDFAGRSIVPERLQGLSPENQYDYSTSGAGRALAAGWNATAGRAVGKLSPIQMDYLLDTNLGFVGDAIVGMTQQTKGGEQLQKDWTEHPVRSMLLPVGNALKQKFVADPLYQSGVTDSFYDAMDTAEKEMNDRNLLEGLDSGVMTPEKKYYSELNKASLEISELRKQERAIMEDKSLSDAERDSAVRKLRREIVNLARAAQENAQKAREEYEKDMDFGVDEKTLYQAINTVVTTQAPEDGSKSRKQAQREALMSLDLTAEQKTELASRMFGGNDMVSWQDMDSFKITNEMKAGDQKLAFALKRAGLDTERAMKYAAIVGETGATYTKGEDGHYTKDVKSIRLKKLNNMVQGDETLTDEQKNSVMRTVVLPELGKKYSGQYAAQFTGDIDAVQLIDAQAAYDEISETVKKDLTINEKNRSEFVRLRFADYLESTGLSRSQQDRLWYFQSHSESDFKEPWSEIIRLGGEDVKKACPKLRDSGMDEATYKAIKAGMDRIYADKDANGETIKDSKKRKLIAYLNEYDDLTTEQKNLLMQADGYKYGMGEKPKSGSSSKKNPFVLPTPTKMPSLKSLIPF